MMIKVAKNDHFQRSFSCVITAFSLSHADTVALIAFLVAFIWLSIAFVLHSGVSVLSNELSDSVAEFAIVSVAGVLFAHPNMQQSINIIMIHENIYLIISFPFVR